jgi:hypothetical protein
VRPWVSAIVSPNPVGILTAYIILMMLIPSSLTFSPLGGVGTPAQVFAVLILLSYTASWLLGQAGHSAGGRAVRIAVLIFAVSVLASFVAAMTRDVSSTEVLGSDRALIEVIVWAGLVVVVSQSITSYRDLDRLLRRAVVTGSIVGAIGIVEYYTGLVVNTISLPGLTAAYSVQQLTARNGLVRPASTTVQPIELAVVMSMLLPFAIHQALDPARRGLVRKWLPVVLIGLAIPMTVSRTGIVGIAIVVLVLVPTWTMSRKWRFLAWAILVIVALELAAPKLMSTLAQFFSGMFSSNSNAGSDLSVSTRTSGYAADWPYIVGRPLFGRGFGTFIPTIYRYNDNQYLTSLVETGFFGLLAYIGLFLSGIHCAGAGRRLTQDREQRHLGQAFVASILAAMVCSFTFDAFGFPMFTGLLFLLLGGAGAYRAIMLAQQRQLQAGRADNKLAVQAGSGVS